MQIFKRILELIVRLIPLQNIILFESCPDLADNTKPVFEELLKRGYNNKYKFIWMCSDEIVSSYPKIKNVKYYPAKKHKIGAWLLTNISKVCICCNRIVASTRKKQKSFYLMHGTPLKDVSGYYTLPSKIDYIITESPGVINLVCQQFGCEISKAVPLGFPRNDVFGENDSLDLSSFFGHYKKYIIWYPTVKQFIGGRDTGIKPIPYMDNLESINAINEVMRKNNYLLVIKPHFAQVTDLIKKTKMSNIIYIDDSFFKSKKISSYKFISSCDALLTDYSSVFYDFLLVNKPIGFTWDDIEAYKKNVGLVENYEWYTSCGKKNYSLSDFLSFIDSLDGIDDYINRRNIVRKVVTTSDFNSTNRVVDFIIKKSKL